MDLKKLSDDSLRRKLTIATFDAENLPDKAARREAASLRSDLQKEIDRRVGSSHSARKRLSGAFDNLLKRNW